MNDANVLYYLQCKLDELKVEIQGINNSIEGALRNVDDWVKDKKNLQILYTSILNTAIAYGYEDESVDEARAAVGSLIEGPLEEVEEDED